MTASVLWDIFYEYFFSIKSTRRSRVLLIKKKSTSKIYLIKHERPYVNVFNAWAQKHNNNNKTCIGAAKLAKKCRCCCCCCWTNTLHTRGKIKLDEKVVKHFAFPLFYCVRLVNQFATMKWLKDKIMSIQCEMINLSHKCTRFWVLYGK